MRRFSSVEGRFNAIKDCIQDNALDVGFVFAPRRLGSKRRDLEWMTPPAGRRSWAAKPPCFSPAFALLLADFCPAFLVFFPRNMLKNNETEIFSRTGRSSTLAHRRLALGRRRRSRRVEAGSTAGFFTIEDCTMLQRKRADDRRPETGRRARRDWTRRAHMVGSADIRPVRLRFRPMPSETIAVAADHAGFRLKSAVKTHLVERGFEVLDLGTDGTESVDYPDFAAAMARALADRAAARGVLACGSGIGMSIAANRFAGVRAALVHGARPPERPERLA